MTTNQKNCKIEAKIGFFTNAENSVEKNEDTTQKILAAMKQNPFVTIEYLCGLCKLTREGLNWNIRKLI